MILGFVKSAGGGLDCENCGHLTVVGLHDTGPWAKTFQSIITRDSTEPPRIWAVPAGRYMISRCYELLASGRMHKAMVLVNDD